MLSNTQIRRLSALALLLLYALSVAGMTLCSCHCADSIRLSALSNPATCATTDSPKSCCTVAVETPAAAVGSMSDNTGLTTIKTPCCMANISMLKAEYQAEQPRLMAAFGGVLLLAAVLPNQPSLADELASTEILVDCYILPPKVPLIYQIACLRL